MRLSQEEQRMHRRAQALVQADRPLTEDEKDLVLNHWQESSSIGNSLDGAFFTPEMLAWDFRLEVSGRRIIDLCAGTGRLAHAVLQQQLGSFEGARPPKIFCIEKNPRYVEVGRRVVPEAVWICADVLQLGHLNLPRFDTAIANPPFGRIGRTGDGPQYRGPQFEFHVIDVASTLAKQGVFLIPQPSAPFRLSGQPFRTPQDSAPYRRFHAETGLTLTEGSLCLDTAHYADGWRGVSPTVEVVVCDFEEQAVRPPQRGAARRATAVPDASGPGALW